MTRLTCGCRVAAVVAVVIVALVAIAVVDVAVVVAVVAVAVVLDFNFDFSCIPSVRTSQGRDFSNV